MDVPRRRRVYEALGRRSSAAVRRRRADMPARVTRRAGPSASARVLRRSGVPARARLLRRNARDPHPMMPPPLAEYNRRCVSGVSTRGVNIRGEWNLVCAAENALRCAERDGMSKHPTDRTPGRFASPTSARGEQTTAIRSNAGPRVSRSARSGRLVHAHALPAGPPWTGHGRSVSFSARPRLNAPRSASTTDGQGARALPRDAERSGGPLRWESRSCGGYSKPLGKASFRSTGFLP